LCCRIIAFTILKEIGFCAPEELHLSRAAMLRRANDLHQPKIRKRLFWSRWRSDLSTENDHIVEVVQIQEDTAIPWLKKAKRSLPPIQCRSPP
jgi:hypothetical protein